MVNQDNVHQVFDPFNKPIFENVYKHLKCKNPDRVLIVTTDHVVHNDFFWELNNLLIKIHNSLLIENTKMSTIIPLPYNSTEDEFYNILKKMSRGTMLVDVSTFFTLTFKKRDPIYFFCDRLIVHRTGEVSCFSGRKF